MLTSKSKTIAKFNVEKLFGNTGIGINRLYFHTRYTVHSNDEENYILNNFTANISVKANSGNKVFLGVGIPEQPFSFRNSSKYDNEGISNFFLNLSNKQIEELEELRKGSELEFNILISCDSLELKESSLPIPSVKKVETIKRVSQSEWLECLDQMGYGRYTLFEIPVIEKLDKENEGDISNDINKARELFQKGYYEEAITTCRIALDELENILEDREELTKAINSSKDGNNRKEMEKLERFYYIRYSIRHATHLAPHPNKRDEERTPFNRHEAQYILALTASTISLFLKSFNNEQ
tara:strand:- start:12498 stop:13385 length:888 start_codon:yes stop_codon:yes gene_type:complete